MCGGWGGWSGLGGSREARWRYAGASCSIVQTCPCSPSLSPDKPGRLENRHTSLLPCGGKPGVFSFLPSSHSFFLLSPPCRFWKQVLPRGGTLPALAQNNQRLLRAAWHRASARPDRWSGRPFFISRGQGAGSRQQGQGGVSAATPCPQEELVRQSQEPFPVKSTGRGVAGRRRHKEPWAVTRSPSPARLLCNSSRGAGTGHGRSLLPAPCSLPRGWHPRVWFPHAAPALLRVAEKVGGPGQRAPVWERVQLCPAARARVSRGAWLRKASSLGEGALEGFALCLRVLPAPGKRGIRRVRGRDGCGGGPSALASAPARRQECVPSARARAETGPACPPKSEETRGAPRGRFTSEACADDAAFPGSREGKQEASPVAARPSEVLRHTRARGAYRHLGVPHSLALPWELRGEGPWVGRVATSWSGLGVGNLWGGRARCWRARPEEVHLPLDAPHPPSPPPRSPRPPSPCRCLESLRRPLCPAAWGLTASRAPG